MHGVLNVHKPASFTSHDVVAIVRKLLKEKQVGHLGTLDPMATGVLPLAVGTATRLIEYASFPKTYRTTCLLGRTTDSCDVTGKTLSETSVEGLAPEKVREAVLNLQNLTEQVPPMVSAVKTGGRKLYELAREGVTVERKARPIRIHKIEILDVTLPRVSFRVSCSAGTYVRVLCETLGEKLGVGGCMEALIREEVGPFCLDNAAPLATLRGMEDGFEKFLLPSSSLAGHLRAITLAEGEIQDLCQGKALAWDKEDPPKLKLQEPLRILNAQGRLCAIGQIGTDDRTLRPVKVFGPEGLS